jgi:hypothetical protein
VRRPKRFQVLQTGLSYPGTPRGAPARAEYRSATPFRSFPTIENGVAVIPVEVYVASPDSTVHAKVLPVITHSSVKSFVASEADPPPVAPLHSTSNDAVAETS